jgi:hypothetical protein
LDSVGAKSALAQNPNISEVIQLQLAKDQDKSIRLTLAKNLGLTKDAQIKICEDNSDEVLVELAKNPILFEDVQKKFLELHQYNGFLSATLIFGNPNLNDKMKTLQLGGAEFCYNELKNNNKSNDIVNLLDSFLDSNPNLGKDVQAIFLRDKEWKNAYLSASDEFKNVKNWISSAPLTLKIQESILGEKSSELKEYLSKNKFIHESIQVILYRCNYDWMAANLTENPALSLFLMNKFVEDHRVEIRMNLSGNISIPESIQIKLNDDMDSLVRCRLAGNINLVESIQEELSKDDEYVKYKLAVNKNLTIKLQFKISEDDNDFIRATLARNLNLCKDVQLKITKDSSSFVREVLAENVNLFKEVQLKLAMDSDRNVRKKLAENQNLCLEAELLLMNDD